MFSIQAPAYTFTENPVDQGNDYAFFTGADPRLVNNSSTLQTIGAAMNLVHTTVETPDAGFDFTGGYIYANGSSAYLKFALTNDVTIDTVQIQNAVRKVYGANGISTTTADPAGTLILTTASGTGTDIHTNFAGRIDIYSGAVRVGDSDALGTPTANTFIHGTFVDTGFGDANAQIDAFGYDHGFGRLELYNDVTITERIRIDGRQTALGIGNTIDADVSDYDDVVNISGNNTLTTGLFRSAAPVIGTSARKQAR